MQGRIVYGLDYKKLMCKHSFWQLWIGPLPSQGPLPFWLPVIPLRFPSPIQRTVKHQNPRCFPSALKKKIIYILQWTIMWFRTIDWCSNNYFMDYFLFVLYLMVFYIYRILASSFRSLMLEALSVFCPYTRRSYAHMLPVAPYFSPSCKGRACVIISLQWGTAVNQSPFIRNAVSPTS